ncbi:MAG: YidC/Oxa1 family membrane protein insertase [Chloroflexota bacterium]|nr:YidC/Oxa1 family membrane protein insertase [Chloroflexota bacterium]
MPRTRNIVLLLGMLLIFLFVGGIISPIELFDLVLLQPILNLLVLLSKYLFGSFGLAIVALTIIIRVITLPLTMRQLRSTKAMQEIQPKMKELQKKYANDREQLGTAMAKLYKEYGVNPLGCAFPMLIQMPIWIALYQAVIQGLGYAPENLLGLSKQLYPWAVIQGEVPLNSHFLGLDLGAGHWSMAILVGVSMWMLQKMSNPPSVDPQQQSMQRLMVWMMPLMFGFFALSFPSGLSLYWFLTNVISMVIQYRVTGWGTLSVPSLSSLRGGFLRPTGTPSIAKGNPGNASNGNNGSESSQAKGEDKDTSIAENGSAESGRKKVSDGKHRNKRKVRRRSR